jgi:hypothetical protein
VLHERLKPLVLAEDIFEVIKCVEDDFVAAFDQADGGQQLEHERFGPQALVDETQGDAVDRLTVLYH